MSDLIERLRASQKVCDNLCEPGSEPSLFEDAANEIESLQARIEEYDKALEVLTNPIQDDSPLWDMVKHPEDWNRAMSDFARTELDRIRGMKSPPFVIENEAADLIERLYRENASQKLTLKVGPESYEKEIAELQQRIKELEDFCIWLTGCGYDFTQHDYFIQMRDKLLKGGLEVE